MTGAIHARNNAHLAEIARRFWLRLTVPDSRRPVVTMLDVVIFGVLCRMLNARTGQLNPGLRALAKAAGCSVSAAADSTHRLRGAGWIDWDDQVVMVGGQRRRGRAYRLAKAPPDLRPVFPSKAERRKRRGLLRGQVVDKSPQLQGPALSVAQYIALTEAWTRDAAARRELTMR